MTKHLFKVPVGDWSKDGHNESKDYYVMCSHTVEEMQQAYRDTCKKIGLQMHHTDNYTDIPETVKHRSWRMLLTEYEQNEIDYEAIKILEEHGFDFDGIDGESDEEDEDSLATAYFDSKDVFRLFMWFISYSLENFEYEEVKAEAIIGYWGKLNHQIGYGVF